MTVMLGEIQVDSRADAQRVLARPVIHDTTAHCDPAVIMPMVVATPSPNRVVRNAKRKGA